MLLMNETAITTDQSTVGRGFFIGCALNVLVAAAGLVYGLKFWVADDSRFVNEAPLLLFNFLGIAQLVYILPLYYYLNKTGRRGIAKGLAIAAAITALLNTMCLGILYTGSRLA
jgi:hypothetical protein